MCIVPGEAALQERVDDHQQEHHAHDDRDPHGGRDRVIAEVDLPRREQSDQPVGPEHVEVGLRAGRHLRGLVRAELPDRVDLQQATHQAEHTDDHREERAGLHREDRHHPDADDVGLGAAGPGELGVLLEPDQCQVNPDERQHDSREQQNVNRVQARDDDVAREVAAEQRPVHPRPDDRDAQRDRRESGADARARQQVVGQRVAEEALEHGQDQQQRADHPVGLAWPAERAGEEDARHVHHDRRREQQGGPVVNLPDEQAASHLEADVQSCLVGPRHLDSAQRLVHPVVGDLGHRGVVEQGQVHPGEQQDDEAVQRHLAQQERPVGGEHLVELPAQRPRRVVPRVDVVRGLVDAVSDATGHDLRSQNAGPTGSM